MFKKIGHKPDGGQMVKSHKTFNQKYFVFAVFEIVILHTRNFTQTVPMNKRIQHMFTHCNIVKPVKRPSNQVTRKSLLTGGCILLNESSAGRKLAHA